MSRRGSVILHVLVMGVVVAVIATGVLRMTLLNYMATQRATTGQQNRKEADGVLNRAITAWNASNTVCSDIPGLTCSPASTTPPGACNCTCGTTPSIVVSGGGPPPCTLTIVSSDPLPSP